MKSRPERALSATLATPPPVQAGPKNGFVLRAGPVLPAIALYVVKLKSRIWVCFVVFQIGPYASTAD